MNWEGRKGRGRERERDTHTQRDIWRQTNYTERQEAYRDRDTQRQKTETESNVKPELRQ